MVRSGVRCAGLLPNLPLIGVKRPNPLPRDPEEIRAQLRKLERHDWWLWTLTVVILILLCLAVLSLSLPGLLAQEEVLFHERLDIAVRGLFATVAIFSMFALYQQLLIKQLRNDLAEQLALSLSLQTRAEMLEKLATQDELTGMYNRRYAMEQLQAEVVRSERYGHPLSVMVLDLDDFKLVNDRHGHAVGDLALQEFSRWLRRAIRSSDIPVRMGGDEFMVLLPECDLQQLLFPLSRMKGCAVEYQGESIPIKFSVGYAQWQPPESPQALLNRADTYLYEHKRNRQQAVAR